MHRHQQRVDELAQRLQLELTERVRGLRQRVDRAAGSLVFREPLHRVQRHRQQVDLLDARLRQALTERVRGLRQRVDRAAGSYVFHEPLNLVRRHRQEVAQLELRLRQQGSRQVGQASARLQRLSSQLRLLNPRQVLTRGYAILLTEPDHRAITAADQVAPGDPVRALLAAGELRLRVTEQPAQESSHG